MKAPGRKAGVATVLAGLLLATPLAAVGVFHVWSRTRVQDVGYELGRLETEHRQLLADRDRLNLEVATLRSPAQRPAWQPTVTASARRRASVCSASLTERCYPNK